MTHDELVKHAWENVYNNIDAQGYDAESDFHTDELKEMFEREFDRLVKIEMAY